MRALVVSSILALAVVVAGCQTIHTALARKVQIGDATFVVIQYGEIAPASLDLDENDKITSQHVYQVTADGRYRHLGSRYPYTSENSFSNTVGTGVYSEVDRALVNSIINESYKNPDNYITYDNKNVGDIKTAVEVITGEVPVKVDSPGSLIFPKTAPQETRKPTTDGAIASGAAEIGNTIDDSQGD